jgi:hypothetical protein
MNITMGAEMALNLHIDAVPSYSDIETALTDAGFTVYTIMRQVNFDDTCDVQLYVRNVTGETGNQEPLDGVDTMQKLTEAIGALEDAVPGAPSSAPSV